MTSGLPFLHTVQIFSVPPFFTSFSLFSNFSCPKKFLFPFKKILPFSDQKLRPLRYVNIPFSAVNILPAVRRLL